MNKPTVKFNTKNRVEFFKVLRQRVNNYFKENNLSKYGNLNMKFKTAFMLCLYFVPFILMVSGVFTSYWFIMLMWAIMAFGMSGIGLSVMHDANHGAYSKYKKVNKAVGFILNFIGGYHVNWKIQHNMLHHTYPNIEGYDEDIAMNTMRITPEQERKWIYNLQIVY
ncbi:MAG: fatty acid desaturase, partial [Flavobacteriales bacterium]